MRSVRLIKKNLPKDDLREAHSQARALLDMKFNSDGINATNALLFTQQDTKNHG
jgi:hypothetical protein